MFARPYGLDRHRLQPQLADPPGLGGGSASGGVTCGGAAIGGCTRGGADSGGVTRGGAPNGGVTGGGVAGLDRHRIQPQSADPAGLGGGSATGDVPGGGAASGGLTGGGAPSGGVTGGVAPSGGVTASGVAGLDRHRLQPQLADPPGLARQGSVAAAAGIRGRGRGLRGAWGV